MDKKILQKMILSAVFFGGDEGTCTPVPPKDQKVFYVCSLSFNVLAFESANRPKSK